MRLRSAGPRKGTAALKILTLACLSLSACASINPRPALVERRVMLMGTALDVELEARDRPAGLAASERAVEALEAAEARLSTWRDDSELSRLNRTPVGEPQDALPRPRPRAPGGAALLGGDRRRVRSRRRRPGAGLGAADRRADSGRGGDPGGGRRRRAAVAADGVAVREKDLLLEEGGWGKGAGLVDALAALRREGVTRASLDVGGQVAVLGGWEVLVADPRRRDRSVLSLSVDGGSVSTSGNSEHGIEVGGRRLGHILDPRTGEPAPDFGSLTVWTADPLRADCLSTGLYVLGPERALAWAAAHPGVEVLALRPDGDRLRALASPGLRGKLRALSPEVEIEFGR